jgi:hypothetical protein
MIASMGKCIRPRREKLVAQSVGQTSWSARVLQDPPGRRGRRPQDWSPAPRITRMRERNQSVQLNASRRSETSPCGRRQKDPFHPPPANEAHFRGAARPDIPADAPFLASSISCSLSGKYTPLHPIFSHSVKATRYHLRASLCFPKAR